MIRVEKHPRGIAVSAEDGLDRNRRTRNLELTLGVGFVSAGRLIAPIETAGAVLDLLGLDGVSWDADALSEARQRQRHRSMQMNARAEVTHALKEPYSVLKGYARLHRLDPHQVAAVAAIVSPSLKGLAVFDEQGTGKTITALAAFDWLREQGVVQRLLVIAPKSVLTAWQMQCGQFLEEQYRVVLLSGSAAARRRTLLLPHDILLAGYEAAVASEDMLSAIISTAPTKHMLVVDESYFVKNPSTARAKVVTKLRASCERAIVLCGTPAPNSAIDVVNQVDIADGGVAFAGRTIPKDPQEARAIVIDALEGSIYLRRLKEEVLPDIPAKQFERIYLELNKRQRQLYNAARDQLEQEVRRVDDNEFRHQISSFLAERVRLLQICSNPSKLYPSYDEIPAKVRALDQLIRELVQERGKKVVIWSYFRASLEEIAKRYDALGVARIDGSVTRLKDRLAAIECFQTDPNTRLFIGNAAAAGAGITLTAAHHAIYESFSNQAAHYLQSIDRIHRRGQNEQTVYHVLIARNTIEEHEYRALTEKERAGHELMGDRVEEPMTRERFLSELEPLT